MKSLPAPTMRAKKMNYKDIITIGPDKRGGKPCIRGLRITVYDVLDYLASGMTSEEILADFDYLIELILRNKVADIERLNTDDELTYLILL